VAKATIYAGGAQYTAQVADAQGRRDIHRAVDAALDELVRQRGPHDTGPQPELCWALMDIGNTFGLYVKAHNAPTPEMVISGFNWASGRPVLEHWPGAVEPHA
jgi:hypothetical protein